MTARLGRGWLTAVRRAATALVVVVLAGCIVVALWNADWAVVAGLTAPTELALLGAALAVNSVGLALGMLSWRSLLAGLGSPIGVWVAARIFFVGLITKFVPGRFWTLLANIRMGQAVGVTAGRITTVYALNLAVMALTGLTVGLIAAPRVLGGQAAWLLLAAMPVLAGLLWPELANRLAGVPARLLRRPAPAPAGHPELRWAIAAQFVSWLVSGAQFWLVTVAVGAAPTASLPICLGAFSLAAVAGTFAVFVPDGIGVREGILMVALAGLLPLPAAGAVVLVSRLVCTMSEIGSAGLALLAAAVIRRRAANRPGDPRVLCEQAGSPAGADSGVTQAGYAG